MPKKTKKTKNIIVSKEIHNDTKKEIDEIQQELDRAKEKSKEIIKELNERLQNDDIVDEFGNKIYKETLWDKIRYKYYNIIPYDWRPSTIWSKIRAWRNENTVVRIKTLSKFGWYDKDIILAHAIFEIFCTFIDEECSPGIVDWYAKGWPGNKITRNGKKIFVRDEMDSLYRWWKYDYLVEYPKKCDELWAKYHSLPKPENDSIMNLITSKEHAAILTELNELEKDYEEQLDKNLLRLVKLRKYFWT